MANQESQPPKLPTEGEETAKETEPRLPEAQPEVELSDEQLEQKAAAAKGSVEQQAKEILIGAPQEIASAVQGVESPIEAALELKEELGLDERLAEIQMEANQLSVEAQLKMNDIVNEAGVERSEEEKLMELTTRRPGESQAAYLQRAEALVGYSFNLEPAFPGEVRIRIKNKELSRANSVAHQLIEKVMSEAGRETPPGGNRELDNSAALARLEGSIGINDALQWEIVNGVLDKRSNRRDEDAFETTTRHRKFINASGGRNEQKQTYWNQLFFDYNTEATRAYASEILDGRSIILLGGGRSTVRREMEEVGIHPHAVTNIDPFVSEPSPDADPVVPVSAADEHLPERLQERGIEKADEIWATFSVPAYLLDPNEIRQLFQNIDALLNDNGNARIWPVMVPDGTVAEVNARRAALMESLREMAASGRYEITHTEASGPVIFHKLPASETQGSE